MGTSGKDMSLTIHRSDNGNSRIYDHLLLVFRRYYLTSSKPANHIKSMEVYNCINLNVRNFPNKKVVGSIPVNCVVSVLAEKNGWVKIGNERWVYKKYLK